MKESYNLNPTLLSDEEIEDYCKTGYSRDHVLRLMSATLVKKSHDLSEEIKIHDANYIKVMLLLQKIRGRHF